VTKRDEDRELARLFEELRRADEVSAPGFREIFERRQVTEVTRAARAMRLAAAAVLAIALGVAVVLVRRTESRSRAAPGPTLAEWKAPTDGLLRTPGAELFDSVPRFPAVPESTQLIGQRGALR